MTSEAQKKAEAAKAAKAEEATKAEEAAKTDDGDAESVGEVSYESVNDAFNNLIAAILRDRPDNEERAALIGQLTTLQLKEVSAE